MSSSHQQTETVDSDSNTNEQLQLLESQILDLKIIVEQQKMVIDGLTKKGLNLTNE